MTNISRPSERGQVLVLIILAMAGLLGFAALAIDGGMIYSDRRIDQNAADASALAGAAAIKQPIAITAAGNFVCTNYSVASTNWNLATNGGEARAIENGFDIGATNDPAIDRPDGDIWLVCDDNKLGSDPDPSGKIFVDVHTRITRQVSTSLMHIFYNGPAINTVDSVVRLYPHDTLAANTAILALRSIPECGTNDKCLQVDGSIDVHIVGGTVASNSNIVKNGGGGSNNGHFDVTIGGTTPSTGVQWGNLFDPGPNTANVPNYPGEKLGAAVTIPTALGETLKARCNLLPEWAADANPQGKYSLNGGTETIHPGKYAEISVGANGRLNLAPGLYCVDKVDFSSNRTDPTEYVVWGEKVTFYMSSNADSFKMSSTARVKLSAPTPADIEGPKSCYSVGDPTHPEPIQGLLIWSDADGTHNPMPEISLNGTATSEFYGSIVAPKTRVNLHGNVNGGTTTAFHVQVIAYDVWLGGNATLRIDYSNDLVPQCGGSLNQEQ